MEHKSCNFDKYNAALISEKAAIDIIDNIAPTKEGIIEPSKVLAELQKLSSIQPEQLSQEIWTKVCLITDTEGLQHEVIHYGDLKRIIFDVMKWMI